MIRAGSRAGWRQWWSEAARRISRGRHAGRRRWLWLASVLVLGWTTLAVLGPMLEDWSTYGFHDWDVMTSYRYITVLSLKEYGEGPWWNPWMCGGFPAFGHYEAASNLVSPYLPVFLLLDVHHAIRVEVAANALIGLAGTYLLAGQFTRSIGLRTLLAIAYGLNGRWALQAATGHGMHLQYCWLPWVLYFFHRAQRPHQLHHAVISGAILGYMVFAGAIYPLPHTALALSLYAVLLAGFARSWRPLATLGIAGTCGVGFGAPKLFAVLDGLSRAPRLIESKEVIGLKELVVMLTDPSQAYGRFPIRVPAYGWHEWGLYVGPVFALCLVLGILFARGPREDSLKIVGILFVLLGFGAFHRHSPWALLHHLPIFSSQHVPSRFHYPMILLLGLVFVAWAGRQLDRSLRRHPWLDWLVLAGVALVASDIAEVSARSIAQAFWMEPPDHIERSQLFEHHTHPTVHYKRRDWAPPILLGMFANRGLIKCYGLDPNFDGVGAIAADAPDYPGRAYVTQGNGSAEVVEWSPNRVVLRVQGASPEALLVYNMNYDPSWSANGKPALDYHHSVAARLGGGNETVELSYFPRTFRWSLPLFALTAAGGIGVPCWWRRRRRRAVSDTSNANPTGTPSSTQDADQEGAGSQPT